MAEVHRHPILPARVAVPATPGCWLRVSAWWHRLSPAAWLPAAAGCARRAPRHPAAPPVAAPGTGAPVPPSAPLPGAAGPEAPVGTLGAAWHGPGSPEVRPQPSLPTCSRCCLHACLSCRWLCSKASRSHSAASRSLRAASRLRPSAATSCCQRAVSHCRGQGRGRGSSGAVLPWESRAREGGEPGAHGDGLSSHTHLPGHLLAWCCPVPELSLEEQAVLSPQPLPLSLGQGVLGLQGWAQLAESRAGSDSLGTQCCRCRGTAGPGCCP